MKVIAHRGGWGSGLENSPEGVALAVARGADLVELDVREHGSGRLVAAHGRARDASPTSENCIEAANGEAGFLFHLKGRFSAAAVDEVVAAGSALDEVIFVSHRSSTLERIRRRAPEAQLGRFGLTAALIGGNRYSHALVHRKLLPNWLARRLRRKGLVVFASCVWEREHARLQASAADGVFVNLAAAQASPGGRPASRRA